MKGTPKNARANVDQQSDPNYRATHSRDGYPLGSPGYPDNREGRRRLARSWKRAKP